jgi:hypothetical protein
MEFLPITRKNFPQNAECKYFRVRVVLEREKTRIPRILLRFTLLRRGFGLALGFLVDCIQRKLEPV